MFSKGEAATPKPSKIRVVGNQLFIGKKPAVTFAPELDAKTLNYLADINVKAGEALEAGEVLYTTRLYDMGELRRFERGAERVNNPHQRWGLECWPLKGALKPCYSFPVTVFPFFMF